MPSSDEEEEPAIYSEEVEIPDDMTESDFLFANLSSDDEETSDDSFSEDSSDDENFDSEEKQQKDSLEKLETLSDERIFDDPVTNDTSPDKIIYGSHLLLCHIRSLIVLIRKSHLINEYVRNQAKSDENIKSGELIIDFHVRWNTTCIMLTKFIEHREIIREITNTPGKIKNLKKSKCDRLISLSLRPRQWEWITTLKATLTPFLSATETLSGRNYETITQIKVVHFALNNFLRKYHASDHLANILKRHLFAKLVLYFEVKISREQSELILVRLNARSTDELAICSIILGSRLPVSVCKAVSRYRRNENG
jgi:hypothetical protein